MNTQDFEPPFQFVGSRVLKLTQTNNFLYLTDKELNRKVNVEYEIKNISRKENDLFGLLHLIIDVELKERGKSKNQYKCHLVIEGCFVCNEDIGEDKFYKMIEINGCASLFSIARAFLISISSQSVLEGKITLPLLNVVNMVNKRKEDLENQDKISH